MKAGIFSGKRESCCNASQPNTGWFFHLSPQDSAQKPAAGGHPRAACTLFPIRFTFSQFIC